jgi:hypothetical protein
MYFWREVCFTDILLINWKNRSNMCLPHESQIWRTCRTLKGIITTKLSRFSRLKKYKYVSIKIGVQKLIRFGVICAFSNVPTYVFVGYNWRLVHTRKFNFCLCRLSNDKLVTNHSQLKHITF